MKSNWVIERFRGQERALKLQAREYKRRLKDLNGEAGRLRLMQSEYIPREVFDKVIQGLEDKIYQLNLYKTSQQGKSELTKYIPWIIAAASFVYSILKK
jgi:hypothetical protein